MLLGPLVVFGIFGAFAFMGVGVGNVGKDEEDPEADAPEEVQPGTMGNSACHAMGYPCMQILIALMLVLYVLLISTAASPFDCVGECDTGWFVTVGCLGSGLVSEDWCVGE
jgi:hypothetical protein